MVNEYHDEYRARRERADRVRERLAFAGFAFMCAVLYIVLPYLNTFIDGH